MGYRRDARQHAERISVDQKGTHICTASLIEQAKMLRIIDD